MCLSFLSVGCICNEKQSQEKEKEIDEEKKIISVETEAFTKKNSNRLGNIKVLTDSSNKKKKSDN